MKHVMALLLSAAVFNSISIEDTKDFKKVLVSIHYDGHEDDKVLVDRDKMESDDLGKVVLDIVKLRTGKN